MKPKRIILIRHGESEGNTDWSVYKNVQNHNIKLNNNGLEQSIDAGKELKKFLKNDSIQFYISPYTRTRKLIQVLFRI